MGRVLESFVLGKLCEGGGFVKSLLRGHTWLGAGLDCFAALAMTLVLGGDSVVGLDFAGVFVGFAWGDFWGFGVDVAASCED